ncbi:hypothetical protein CDV31_012273 [Fusarium ambrosium]|uniref:Alpha/beta hydrolase fold-3 domain-containing protein n=1 Tax=Fusarium ambrosium TaxID=131363 RepID=A0A428TBD0_9HYPO|nr:hypothetical protein CDV31_012273 [Fusarium ambrosium]
MPSEESRALEDLYHRVGKILRGPGVDLDLHRIIVEQFATVATEPTDVKYEEVNCPGSVRPAIWCTPLSSSPKSVILYTHGGGFIACSPSSHRKLVGHLAKRAGCHAIIIDYRLAPEYQFPAQIEDVVATYKWLINNRGFSSKNIAFVGDSAGGNLTVSATLAARNLDLDVPGAIVGFSPWIDMKLTGKSFSANLHTDALVYEGAMDNAVAVYVGGASLDSPLLDLPHAELKGFPPMYLTSGTAEVFQDDAIELAKRARAAGVDVQLESSEGMQHVWVYMAGKAPEADKTLSEAAEFIRSKIVN